jgi:hypothetical protein
VTIKSAETDQKLATLHRKVLVAREEYYTACTMMLEYQQAWRQLAAMLYASEIALGLSPNWLGPPDEPTPARR